MIVDNIINELILPEFSIAVLIGLMVLVDLLISKRFKIIIYLLSQTGLLLTIFFVWNNFKFGVQGCENLNNNFIAQHGFILNPEINCLKLIIVSLTFVIFVYIKDYLSQINSKIYTEYFVLNLFSLLGVMLLVSSNNFFNFYFGMEMAFLPIYILVGINQRNSGLEVSIKYIILSAIFSGVFLYGLSLIYGASGGLTFKTVIEFIQNQHISGVFNVGITLVLIGIFFKLHIFPFQFWAPGVYRISSCPIIMLISSLPKIALIGVLGYLFKDVLCNYINLYWKNILLMTSLSSMFVGNFGAIIQNNIKSMLAYSAIANSGFILLGLVNNTPEGVLAANFCVISYALVIINILGCLIVLNNHKRFEEVEDFVGLSKEHPWISAMLLILLLSMVGVPPTIGFYAKFLIVKSLIKIDLIWVAVTAGLLSAISLIYYLKIIKNMYFIENYKQSSSYSVDFNQGVATTTISKSNCSTIMLLTINSLLVLFLGFFRLLKI